VEVICRLHSDHNPLLLRFGGLPLARGPRPFRFEAAWIDHEEYANFVSNSWSSSNHNITASLDKVRENSINFNKEVFGNIFQRKKHNEKRLKGIQTYLERVDSLRHTLSEKDLQREYNHILFQEEMLWYQKSRDNWVKFGDKSSSFFHAQTIIRRKKTEFISFSFQLVIGIRMLTSSKRRPKPSSRSCFVAHNTKKTANSKKAPTPPLMTTVRTPSPHPLLKMK